MSEVKDPAIKLFGKTIQLPSNDDVSASIDGADLDYERSSEQNISCSNEKNDTASDSKLEDGSSSTVFAEPNTTKEPTKSSSSQKEEQSETTSSSQDNNKPLKKPDKILPCPRCNSMDTKFCYFNNYNVNQPRHFCKNCQRYWTAGGTMRNVPVGAGRRKSKNSTLNNSPRHIVIPNAIQTRPNGIIYPASLPSASDAPLCESMASALKIADNKALDNTNGNGCSSSSPKPAEQESTSSNVHGFVPQVPCFSAPPWPHPWNPAQWSGTMAAPPFLPPGFPVSVYATPPYCGSWGMGMPLMMQRPCVPSADQSLTSSSPNSPLGKHSREGNGCEMRTERKVLTPKMLRIDDPNEAAKSSIWATLGIKNEKKGDSINSGGLFRGFKSKGDDEMSSASADSSLVLQANPAALSRSLTFQESAQ
ncbi:hypothetical protein V2J09_019977 [Rumex salicifolius]